eukprot:scaffold184701_cov38-Prasinocladus_malaysianus.AAC.2
MLRHVSARHITSHYKLHCVTPHQVTADVLITTCLPMSRCGKDNNAMQHYAKLVPSASCLSCSRRRPHALVAARSFNESRI